MTTPNPFSQPAKNSGFFSPRDHADWLGRLFLIYPDRIVTKTFQADEGPVDMVEADVAIIDLVDPQTGQPTVLAGTTIGGKALVPQLKTQLGAMVLGRLAQTAAQGQKSGAYFLAEYTDADAQTAMAYIAAHPRQQFSQPQTQAPAPQPYGQGVPQAQPQYASQALPYDPWQGTQAAAPAGPPQGQWGTPQGAQGWAPAAAPPAASAPGAAPPWGAPAASAQAAPAPTPPASPSAVDPALAGFLTAKQVPVQGMEQGQALMIARTFPDCPPQFQQ